MQKEKKKIDAMKRDVLLPNECIFNVSELLNYSIIIFKIYSVLPAQIPN